MLLLYHLLAKKAMTAIIPFESGFSTLVAIKTKIRNLLDAKDDMRVALSKTTPQFHLLIEDKQQQLSY